MQRFSKGVVLLGVGSALLAAACGGSAELGADEETTTQEEASMTPTCPSACGDPMNNVEALPTAQSFFDAIVGKWEICAGGQGAFANLPSDVIGVEYGVPEPIQLPRGTILRGKMYYLVMGADGPKRGPNIDYELTYDVSQIEDDAPPLQLNMRPTPSSKFFGRFAYNACPRQWAFYNGVVTPQQSAFLVPLD